MWLCNTSDRIQRKSYERRRRPHRCALTREEKRFKKLTKLSYGGINRNKEDFNELSFGDNQHELSRLCKVDSWRSVCGLTLNLKQSVKSPRGATIGIDEYWAKKGFGQFMRRLNRAVYGSANRHHGKRLRVVPIIEKSLDGRLHYHVAIEPPAHLDNDEFCRLAMLIWLKTPLGYGHGDVAPHADAGWIDYMTKKRSKNGFEHYFDCIDTDAFFNPVASA